MSTAFEILYDLAIDIQVLAQWRKLTAHHSTDRAAVEALLRRHIVQTVMPGEAIDSRWKKLRIFCRNYVNRAQPAVTDTQMQALLDVVEQTHTHDDARVAALAQTAAETFRGKRGDELAGALRQFTSEAPVPALGGLSYLDWIDSRWMHWSHQRTQDLDADALLRDIQVLSADKATKIAGIGLPLAANFFADLGLATFAKPDLHVTPIINLLVLGDGETEAFRGLIRIAKQEATQLERDPRFAWLLASGGLQPRFLDRLIYLIGSDNFQLNGVKKKRWAPERRRLMRDALLGGGLVSARYQ